MKPVIMFVDDEPNILRGLRRMTRLGCDGWEMLFAEGGEEALNLFDSCKVDAVVSDMRMPGIDGAALLSTISERSPQTLRFLLSGHADHDLTCGTIGVSHQFYAKPCDGRSLVMTLTEILEWRDALAQTISQDVIAGIDRLSVSSDVYHQVCSLLQEETADTVAIGSAIRRDPSLSIRILQLANSAYFGKRSETCDVGMAVNELGADVLRTLFNSGGLVDSVSPTSNSDLTDIADAAWSTARSKGFEQNFADMAHAAGLLLCHTKANGWSADGSTAPAAYLACLLGLPPKLVKTLDRLQKVDNLEEPAETGWRIAQAIWNLSQEAA